MKNRYIALLRGINVGGNRKVAMAELRDCFATLGFTNVTTYINSGNIIFDSSEQPNTTLVQSALTEQFGFVIDALIISADSFKQIAAAVPQSWNNDYADQKTDVLFLFDDVNLPEVITTIGYRPEFETLLYVDGAILSNLARKDQTKSSLLRLVGTSLYARMTVRNVNTVRKLVRLLDASTI